MKTYSYYSEFMLYRMTILAFYYNYQILKIRDWKSTLSYFPKHVLIFPDYQSGLMFPSYDLIG